MAAGGAVGRVARGGKLQREGKWVQEVARAPCGEVGEVGGGLRPSSAAGGAGLPAAVKQRGRQEVEEGWTSL